jgi:hypothetical protein
MVFDREGRFLRAWGEGMFQTTHFLRVTRAGRVWVTDHREGDGARLGRPQPS